MQAAQYTAASDTLEVWANTPGMEKHEEQANCLAHVENTRLTLAELVAAGKAYHATLLVMKEKYEHLQVCSKYAVWLDQQETLFKTDNLGDSLVAAEDLIRALQESYYDALVNWKRVRDVRHAIRMCMYHHCFQYLRAAILHLARGTCCVRLLTPSHTPAI
jgi:hypothetical protein